MNKKIFGIKISTILQAIMCIVLACFIWLTVKYTSSTDTTNSASALLDGGVCASEVL